MTKPIELLGSYWTLGVGADPLGDQCCRHDFRRRVEIAAAAGFKGMGFWHADIVEIRRHYSFQQMKQVLDDNGIVRIEVEWLRTGSAVARDGLHRTRPGRCCSMRRRHSVQAISRLAISATTVPVSAK